MRHHRREFPVKNPIYEGLGLDRAELILGDRGVVQVGLTNLLKTERPLGVKAVQERLYRPDTPGLRGR